MPKPRQGLSGFFIARILSLKPYHIAHLFRQDLQSMLIPHRYSYILFGALLSAIMVSIVSASVILINQGTAGFFSRWANSLLTTWPIAFAAILVIAPLVRKLVARLTISGTD